MLMNKNNRCLYLNLVATPGLGKECLEDVDLETRGKDWVMIWSH